MRPQKGKNMLMFPADCTVIDLETTGLSPECDEIIELAAIRIRNHQIADTFCTLIHPSDPVDDYISALTDITNDMLADAPAIADALPAFLSFVGQDIVVGHNVNFDVNFVYDICHAAGCNPFSNDFVDTMRIARKLYPDLPHHRLADVVDALGISTDRFHRALRDCDATFGCLQKMRDDCQARYGTDDLTAVFPLAVSGVDLRNLTTDNTDFDPTHPLYGKTCVFTGKLEKMTRQQAAQMVLDVGGICADSITKKTNYLVLGNSDYCAAIRGGKSSKQKKAEQYKLDGRDIEIIPEDIFYDMIDPAK